MINEGNKPYWEALAAIAMFAADFALYLRRYNPGLYSALEDAFATIADIVHRAFFIEKRVTRYDVEIAAGKFKLLLDVAEKSGIKDGEYFRAHFAPAVEYVNSLLHEVLGESALQQQ